MSSESSPTFVPSAAQYKLPVQLACVQQSVTPQTDALVTVKSRDARHVFTLRDGTNVYQRYPRHNLGYHQTPTIELESLTRRAATALLVKVAGDGCQIKAVVMNASNEKRTIATHEGKLSRRDAEDFLSLLEVRSVDVGAMRPAEKRPSADLARPVAKRPKRPVYC